MQDEFKKVKGVVLNTYNGWILGSIRRTYEATKEGTEGSTPLAAFILTSCAIDFFAGFLCGIDSFKPKPGETSKNYIYFLKKYMIRYEPEDIYENIRCRLAHNYSIGGKVALTHRHPEYHDPIGSKGQKIINFENFFEDFQLGVNRYLDELERDIDLQSKFTKRYKLGVAGPIPLRSL